MILYYFTFIFLFICFISKSFCYKGFTIDTQGKKVVTTKVTNQGDCSSVAFTEIGTLIKYKSDSSIISTKKLSNSNLGTEYTQSSFICQYTNNELVLTRDKKIFKITLNTNGGDSITYVGQESQGNIDYLHCNMNKYIYTYLTDASKKYNAKTSDNKSISGTLQSNEILSSSCFLVDSSLALCIIIIKGEKKLKYYYHNLDSSSTNNGELDISNGIYEIKDSIIKHYSNNEIILCLSAKPELISDIFFYCYKLNADTNTKQLSQINTDNPRFSAIDKITDERNYCQLEKLSGSNLYASICLCYYYRTTYLLSIFQYNTNTKKFEHYKKDSSNEFKNLDFPLLKKSPISIIAFQENTLGIFYQDIDQDSMILVFYPKCGIVFYKVPVSNINVCDSFDLIRSGYFFDECTHTALPSNIKVGYTTYEKNQFCQIKKIASDGTNDYYLDNFINGYYTCRSKNEQNDHYYFDSTDNKFKKCFRSCLKCYGAGTESDNNCQSCDTGNGFYPFTFNNPNQCVHKNEPMNYYFFDGNTNQFKRCRQECLSCTEYPSDLSSTSETDSSKDTKCKICNIDLDYWPQIDKPSNCIKSDRTNIQYYYTNSYYKRWEKCTVGCKYCTEYGTSIYDTKCDTSKANYCDTDKGYYPVESDDGSTINPNCFQKDVRYDHYYFDENDNKFKKCNVACLQCDTWGNITIDIYNTSCLENKCDTKNNYFPNEDKPTVCYKKGINHPFYYFDPNTKKFKKCHEYCSYCKEQIDANENDTQCISCYFNYYPLSGTETNQDNKNCIHKDKLGYYFHDNKMYKCPEKCTKCRYTHIPDYVEDPDGDVYCNECNNEIGFYQVENMYYDQNNLFMECYTWRKEKIDADPHYNKHPALNTLFVGNVFKICNPACSQCTSIDMSLYSPHCQAKKCNPGYLYVQNNEDICFPSILQFPFHYIYSDPILHETYFRPCYQTCQTCSAYGTKRNNNCIQCREGFIFHPNSITNAHNCIFDCLTLDSNNYYYLDENNNDEYICVEKCPEEYPYLQPEKKRCLKSCSTEEVLKYSKDRICVNKCPEGTTDNVKKECVSVSNECIKSDLESTLILNDINDTNINSLIINYCHDYSYTSNQINIITNKLNEYTIYLYKNKKCIEEFYKDINFPELSVCFDELKNYYEINPNQDLIVMILNIKQQNSYVRVEYKVFDSITCEELYLGNCSKKEIFTDIKMERYFDESNIQKSKTMYINEDINVYDREHPFFTDICYQFSYEGDKDMILEDRVNMYYQNISNICEKKCEPKADFDKRVIKCGCNLKEEFLIEDNEEDKNKKWGFGVGGISVEVLKCSKKAFLWKHFKENTGSYTGLVLIAAEFPVVIYFIVVGLSKIKIFLIPFMGVNPPKKKSINSSKDNKSNNSNNNNNENHEKEEKKERDKSDNISNNINNENNKNNKNIINRISQGQIDSNDKIISSDSQISDIRVSKDLNDKNSDEILLKRDIEASKQEFEKKKFDI